MLATAMILAAGRGERLRPLTDLIPKPLLRVGEYRLLEWHLRGLSRAGVHAAVVNLCWLEEQFEPALGDGSSLGIRIVWSKERNRFGHALETAGGVAAALPYLADPFWVVSADVFIPEFPFDPSDLSAFKESSDSGRLWFVESPQHHPAGDYLVDEAGRVRLRGSKNGLTWASVGLFKHSFFAGISVGESLPLRPLLDAAALGDKLSGSMLPSRWLDVGTESRLFQARDWVS